MTEGEGRASSSRRCHWALSSGVTFLCSFSPASDTPLRPESHPHPIPVRTGQHRTQIVGVHPRFPPVTRGIGRGPHDREWGGHQGKCLTQVIILDNLTPFQWQFFTEPVANFSFSLLSVCLSVCICFCHAILIPTLESQGQPPVIAESLT